MPKRSSPPPETPPAIKEPHEAARAKIRNRIGKGEELKAQQVQSSNQAEAFEKEYQKWNDYNEQLLRALFTDDSFVTEYRWSVTPGVVIGQESGHQRYRRRLEEITQRCNALESLVERLELIPLVPGVTTAVADPRDHSLKAAWPLLHDKVRAVARQRVENGQYADAVEAALKSLNNEVKTIAKSRGAPDMDGATLMHTVFSQKNPIIVLADLSTQTGKDMQQGYMELFAGTMSAVRNPKAHDNVSISPERALHLLFLASTLWYTLDARL